MATTGDSAGEPPAAASWGAQDRDGTLRAVGAWWAQLLDGLPAGPAAAPLAQLADALGCPPTVDAVGAGAAALAGPGAGGAAHRARQADIVDLHLATVSAAGRALASTRPGAGTTAVLERINASGGGVPKLARPEGRVGWGGLEGDRQRVRRHHGRPWQALCLWSADVVDDLAAEGHPLTYGGAGENLTVRGLDWALVRAGVVLGVGPVRLEVSVFAEPCRTIAGCFRGGDFGRIQADRHPGTSRVYARVLRPGPIRAGDPVVVEPDL